MRIWSLHPKYLDSQGLVALWRESLLAQAVLRGETMGYKNHPQLERFKDHATPLIAMAAYLKEIYIEAECRGFSFDKTKIHRSRKSAALNVTLGQLEYEWTHLMKKLKARKPSDYAKWHKEQVRDAHPIFTVRAGAIEKWERL